MNAHDWYPSYKPVRQRQPIVRLRTVLLLILVAWGAYEAGWRGYSNMLDAIIEQNEQKAGRLGAVNDPRI